MILSMNERPVFCRSSRLTGLRVLVYCCVLAPLFGQNNGDIRRLSLWIDGVETPPVTRWEGGDPRIRYTADATGPGLTRAGVDYTPLVLDFGIAPPPVVQTWLKEFCARQNVAHRLVVSDIALNRTTSYVPETREYVNVRMVEARVIDLNSPRVSPILRVKFEFDGLQVLAPQNPSASPVAGVSSALQIWTPHNLRHSELIVPRAGPVRLTGRLPATHQSSYLIWRNEVVQNISNTNTATILGSGFLTFRKADPYATDTLFMVKLSGVKIVRYTQDIVEADRPAEADVEMLVEEISIITESDGAAAVQADRAAAAAAAAAAQAEAAAAAPPATPPSPSPAPQPATTPAASDPGRMQRVPVRADETQGRRLDTGNQHVAATLPGAVPGAQPVAPTVTLPTIPAGDSKESGLRDPAAFPRPEGLVRNSFAASSSLTRVQESATYTATGAFDEVVKRFEELAVKEGWAETSRSESGTLEKDRMTMTYWKRDKAEADLRIYGRATGVEASVSVVIERAPARK